MTPARWLPALAVVVAAVAVVTWQVVADDPDPVGPTTTTEPAPVAVSSDAPRLASLAELAAASDVVVRGRVLEVERGRLFGEPGSDAAIESRLVTLEVTELLRGSARLPRTVLVEEEGWTADGAPLVVDGAAASEVGDQGIWFLQQVASGEERRYVVVSAEGRYLAVGDRLEGAQGDDPLIAQLVALGPAGLEAALHALPEPART